MYKSPIGFTDAGHKRAPGVCVKDVGFRISGKSLIKGQRKWKKETIGSFAKVGDAKNVL